MICNKCGTELKKNSSKCENCGTVILPETKKTAITYDYRTVEANHKNVNETIDCYEAMGWTLADKKESYISGSISLSFKRNRKIKNKEHLNRLQVKLDDHINGIGVLEKRKTQFATTVAIIIGVIGTLFFGTGMCLCMPDVFQPTPDFWMYIAGGVFSIIGMLLCGTAYLVYKNIRTKNTVKMDILIDKKRDEISNICEESQDLLV